MALPESLLQSLGAGKIVPFVGAGVSRAVRHAETHEPLFGGWSELLLRAATKLDEENKGNYATLVRSLLSIDPPDYLQAASRAKDNLGASWFTFLKDEFDHERMAASDESLTLARTMWKLGSNLVVTTNFDRVLAWACDRQDDLATWNIESPAEQAGMLRSGLKRPVIWHLHGTIDDASHLILTPNGYNRLYPTSTTEATYVAAIQTLRFLLSSHSLLFVGFSFADSEFGITLDAVRDVFSGASGPHYALIHAKDWEAAQQAKLHGIELIPFQDYGQPLLETLQSLTAHAQCRPSITRSGKDASEKDADEHEGFDSTCDTPPPIGNWVGRGNELKLLEVPTAKVVAITGIGGQGKSTLVAKFLESSASQYSYYDWRDCKEEDNTLHTHLVRIVERLTGGRTRATDLASECIESVIRLFLNLTASLNAIFVFDNIDHYVDLQTSEAARGMGTLIQSALRSSGPTRIILTARPRLYYDSPYYLQIELPGLDIKDARALFHAREVAMPSNDLEELHALVKGHPLWMGLIANQMLAKRLSVRDLVARIRGGKDTDLPTIMLREIWGALKSQQQKLMRYLAEFVQPQTEQHILEVVSPDLSRNQLRTTLGHLKALDLVVVKSPVNAPDTIELHPLVREFVRRQFSRLNRGRYISAIITYLDRAIDLIRTGKSTVVTFDTLQSWTAKIEVLTNGGNPRKALDELADAGKSLLDSGYSEDFVRLSYGVLAICDRSDSSIVDSRSYESVYEKLIEVLSQLGRFDDAESQLKSFELTAGGTTARYICVCRLRAYYYWSRQEYELAKEWGQRGVTLRSASHIDTQHDCSHDLALAQRDSGDTENALKYFLEGVELATVANPTQLDASRHASFYGNIGRTLFLMGRDDDALSCLLKSAWLLDRQQNPRRINVGWADCWLGEMLERRKDMSAAYICFRRAYWTWKNISPYRAESVQVAAERIESAVESYLSKCDESEVEHRYHVWLSRTKQF